MGYLRPKEFLNRLQKAPTVLDARAVINDEHLYLSRTYNTVASLKKAFTDYRNYYKNIEFKSDHCPAIDIDQAFFSTFRLNDEQQDEFKRAKTSQVISDMAKLRTIDNVDGYIELSISLLQGSSYLDKIIGLCALTGRRRAEIATSAEFTCVGPHAVIFDGQLKVKERAGVEPYQIPTLHDSSILIKTLNLLRQERPVFINNYTRFHNCCSKDIGRRVKKHYATFFHAELKPKDLRSIYAEICYKLFNEESLIARPLYYSRVLGHGDQDIVTAQSYDDFRITDPKYI